MTIGGSTKLAGVMGQPVAHSLSPRLHNYWLEQHGIDGAYLPLPVAPAHFAQAIRVLAQLGFAGVNVTVPHKQAALAAVDEIDASARRVGAVNTITVRDDGSLLGSNSDGAGFLSHLGTAAPDFEAAAGPALVIGAGGAARSIAAALSEVGVPELRLCNRTLARAEDLAVEMGGSTKVVNWMDRAVALEDVAILVNATTQGMTGQPPLDIGLDRLPQSAVVYDIVYNPSETPLMAAARGRGNSVIGGLGMLVHQAVPGFEAWFGVRPEVTADVISHVAQGLA